MSTTSPQLEIPISLSLKEALEQLAKLKKELEAAGAAGRGGFEKTNSTLGDLKSALGDVARSQGYLILKDAAGVAAEGFKEAAEHVRDIAREYVQLRKTLQEVSALTGRPNTGSFTADQARAAKGAGLMPSEWVKFQEAFQSVAGAYTGNDPGSKMNAGQAEEYQKRLAQFAKSKGVSADSIAELGGSILQFAEGPISVNEAMNRAGRAFFTLERARTPADQLLKPMTGVMAQGASADEAAQLLNLAGEIKPGEEETYVTNMLKALDKAIVDGKGGELGVADGMTPLQKIRSASQTLAARMAGGESMLDLKSQYFPDLREARAAEGFVGRGVLQGGFDRVAGYIRNTPNGYAASAIKDFAGTDAGQYAQAEADLAANRVVAGGRFQGVELARKKAEAELTAEGRFGQWAPTDILRSVASGASFGVIPGSRDQLIQERAMQNAERDARALGIDPNRDPQHNPFGGRAMGAQVFNDDMIRILKSIDDRLAKANSTKPQPFSANPPRPRVNP